MNRNAETSIDPGCWIDIDIDIAMSNSNATASTSNSRDPSNGNAVVIRILLINDPISPSLQQRQEKFNTIVGKQATNK